MLLIFGNLTFSCTFKRGLHFGMLVLISTRRQSDLLIDKAAGQASELNIIRQFSYFDNENE